MNPRLEPPPRPPRVSRTELDELAASLLPRALERLEETARVWAGIKEAGGRVVVVTGSGPNIHEGVTTQVAELINLGLVDGVITSSAVMGHELAGALELVRRVDGSRLGLSEDVLPQGGMVEVALLSAREMEILSRDTILDLTHYRRLVSLPGREIIKVAGNLAYPTGLWAERAARQILALARAQGITLEEAAGLGCDPLTMLGAAARRRVPCLVSVPQLVGGGQVGVAVGDSVSISRRSALVARLLASADLIIESGVALTQEIHDGPYELFTGHGLWARHEGMFTFSLRDKRLARIDLDPGLEKVWRMERDKGAVASAIDLGRPKAVELNTPFRMEMSGFARLPGALPVPADLGRAWPVLVDRVTRALGVKPGFVCYKQGTETGEAIRRYIVENVRRLDMSLVVQELEGRTP